MLLLLALLASFHPAPEASAPEVRWVRVSGDDLAEVGGYLVEGYQDAGVGGMDWTVVGEGVADGHHAAQLWMMEAPLAARTTLPVASEAVAFMMGGDQNDGYATFLVDGEEVGTFDMYRRTRQTLVVENLPLRAHTLEVRMTGQKRLQSLDVHVAIWGGSALVREIVAMR